MEERGLTISRHITDYLGAMTIKTQRSIYREKESEDIHLPGIDVGGGWKTGCGSHPQSSELMEELEESVCTVVQQGNEREDQGEGVHVSGKTVTDVRGRDMGIEECT